MMHMLETLHCWETFYVYFYQVYNFFDKVMLSLHNLESQFRLYCK